MSIYIKGLNAPVRCSACDFCTKDGSPKVYTDYYSSPEYRCVILKKKIALGVRRPVDCPIMDIPDHGDLIDRDVLMTHLIPGGAAAMCARIVDVVIPEDRGATA